MPSTKLTTHSTLLTSCGWIETSRAGAVAAIGVDRHGQLSNCVVEITPTNEVAREHFLGTRSAFGVFHGETVVIDAAGERRLVKSICGSEDVQALKWESCVSAGDLMRLESGMNELWDAFSAIALSGNHEVMMIKSFLTSSAGKKRFVELSRSQLERDYLASGYSGIAKSIKSLLGTEADVISVDRYAYRLILWLATSRQAMGEAYRLEYDSIQHTSAVKVDLDAKVGQVEALRTAFLAGPGHGSAITWSERSWSPISSGFILAGRTA